MPGSSDTTAWKDISTLDSGGLAEYLRSRGFKVASAIVWLESSPRASGWHLNNWAKAVEGLQVQQMRELVDRVYREDTERFRTFGVFAGIHSSIPMKELEELVPLGCNSEPPPHDDGIEPDAVEGTMEGELLTTQEMDDAGASPANCQDILGVSSLSSEGVEEVMDSVIEETQPPHGCFPVDAKREEGQGATEGGGPDGDAEMEGLDDAVATEAGAGSGVSSEGSEVFQRRTSKRLSAGNSSTSSSNGVKRRRSSMTITTAPTRRSATAKSSPATRRRLPGSCSSSPVARTSSGRRMSSTSHKVLMLSGVGVAIERSANGLCNRLGGAKIESLDRCLEKGVTPKPSHVIVPNKKAVVTLKVLYGLCTPTCSIVREGWLAACRSASQWVPVDQYLVEDWADRPSWTVGKSGPLERMRIHSSGEMQSIPNVEHYHNLVRLCGGVVDKESPRGARVVVVGKNHKLPARLLFDLKHGVVPTPTLVTEDWLMQCLKTQTLIDEFDQYLPSGIFDDFPDEWHD
ncbi:hypothetical protein FOZ63_031723 [Perkinsus olseni]|uniref:BRCT domain-containing protein n=1 Tax=Perkinsus olseni TaxID=32597 RepID=A0A7J6U481_PEROL|nr:hypothetical protein FOZ63_031723 [Perkinsus olseni]